MKKLCSLLLAGALLLCAALALAEGPVSLDALITEIDKEAKTLTVGPLSFAISEDRQSIYIDRPQVTGAEEYTIAYNIYDAASNPVNYFYSLEERVAATPGYGGLFNVFVVVTDAATGEQNTSNIGWQELSWPLADRLTVGKASFEVSPDKKSIFVDRPSIACRSGRVTIAYNIYDHNSQPVNYFYSTEKRVAATPGYDGKFNVFIVVTDTVTGEQDVQNIGWTVLGEGPQPTAEPEPWPAAVDGIVYDLIDGRVTVLGCEKGVTELRFADQVNGEWVKDIADNAFLAPVGNGGRPDGKELESEPTLRGTLTLPSRLERIGSRAFCLQGQMTGGIALPDTLTSLGYAAFAGTGFTSLQAIPESLKAIPDQAFAGSMLNCTVRVPADCDVHSGAFDGAMVILTWDETWPFTLRGITYRLSGNDVVAAGCEDSLTELAFADVIFGRKVTVIGEYGFSSADGMHLSLGGTLTLPKYLKTIEPGAFQETMITGSLVIPEGVTAIGTAAFWDCSMLDGTLSLPSGLRSMGDMAFSGCAFTGELRLPASLTVIPGDAFAHCAFTGNLVIPEGVEEIRELAFRDCPGWTGLTLPGTLRQIGEYAFSYCTGLTGAVTVPAGCDVHSTAFEGTSVTLVIAGE